ncbi:unnamed protein product, partial [Rotaria magnacalcarata]
MVLLKKIFEGDLLYLSELDDILLMQSTTLIVNVAQGKSITSSKSYVDFCFQLSSTNIRNL